MTDRRIPWRALILLAIAAVATFAFVAIADEMREGEIDALDTRIALAVHSLETPVLDYVMIAFTNIGTGPAHFITVLAVSLWAIKRKRVPYVVVLVAVTVAAVVLNPLLKEAFSRARPTLFEVIRRPDTYSFPSGHAMSAMTIYGAIAAVAIALRPSARTPIVICAAILIACIGFSRVYLGVHWPMDVLAGWAAGVPFVVVAVHILHRLQQTNA
ncbi:MAG: phosphatase PAP2 family protein [Kofleriaceae bacterium]|nr:phosphatase PAP2 family protein [Kofleriaceae bacterium]